MRRNEKERAMRGEEKVGVRKKTENEMKSGKERRIRERGDIS